MLELLVFALVILVPFPIGFALAHYRPQSKNLKNAAWAALPACLPFFGFGLWIVLTQDLSCEDPPCQNMAPMWAMAMGVLGVLTAVTGYGVGLLGDAWARNRARKRGE
ncbi:hypothetical protein OZN62_00540 [Aurantiacibacter sp. MUD11]|uniref:hypothetical protein n=1 Tax=Aurantiacibacter sp. MUD11 TaxID=3003265 RepID=UPI0022AA6109|nr:hypothetical protein [Aurantiacibacter sp. MUD11]WAT18097.1 hypothetical protein OZN62_00540 [Aurantiacibacter sp. MUD11]